MSSLQPATPRDLLAFAITSRAIKVRPATASEKAAGGIAAADAKVILLSLCRGRVLKAVFADRPLKGDVTEPARDLARMQGRPAVEAHDAATCLPLLPGEALAEIADAMMGALTRCKRCTCAAGYVPLVAGLAEATAKASSQPEAVEHLEHQVEVLSAVRAAARGASVIVSDEHRAAGDVVRSIIRAAGY